MLHIQQITLDATQKQTLVLPDGTRLELTISFVPMQYGWFIRNLTYGDFELNNVRITVSPNILYQFKNQLPFGLACTSKGNREPSLQQDFTSGDCKLFILTAAEVEAYSDILSGQA